MKFLYPGFRNRALTFSYDDATVEDIRLADLFRKYRLQATFNLNSGLWEHCDRFDHGGYPVVHRRMAASLAPEVYRGFEAACHGVLHQNFTLLSEDAFRAETAGDRDALTALFGTVPQGIAYPCGCWDWETVRRLRSLGFRYARTVEDTRSFTLPEDFLAWHPTCHDHDPELPRLIRDFLADPAGELPLLYIWGHSFELEKPDADRWAQLKETCRRLAGREDTWYADNGSICRYVEAVRAARNAGINGTGETLWLLAGDRPTLWKPGEPRPEA